MADMEITHKESYDKLMQLATRRAHLEMGRDMVIRAAEREIRQINVEMTEINAHPDTSLTEEEFHQFVREIGDIYLAIRKRHSN